MTGSRALTLGALGVLLAVVGVLLAASWWAVPVLLVGVGGLVAVGLGVPLIRAWKALDALYRAADQALSVGTDVVAADTVAEIVDSVVPPSRAALRRREWSRVRRVRQGGST